MEYCSAVWCDASKACLKRLERFQFQLARAISRVYPPTAALTAADLLTLAWCRRDHCLVMLWKLIHSQGPPQLKELLPPTAKAQASCLLRSTHSIEFPLCSSHRQLSAFFFVTIPIWNSLPSHVVSSSSVASFLISLRRYFANDKFSFGLV